MSEINRQDLISDEALQAPLTLAENMEKVLATLDKIATSGKKSSDAISKSGSTTQLKKEIDELTKSHESLATTQGKLAASNKAYITSNNEVAEANKKLAEQGQKTGAVVSEMDKAWAKASNSATAYGGAVKKSVEETKKAEKAYKAEAGSLEELVQTREKLKQKIQEIKVDQKEDLQLMKDGTLSRAEYNQRLIETTAQIDVAKKSLQLNNAEVKNHIALQGQDAKKVDATNSSLKVLEAALNKNRKAYANLSNEQKRNSKEGQELLKIITKQDEQSKKLSETIGQNQKSVGDYSNAIKDALGPLGTLVGGQVRVGSQLVNVGRGFQSAASKVNIFSLALRAIPILAIIGAIASLITYFRGSEEGAQKFRIVLAALEQVMSSIKDVMIGVGKAIVEAFENPQQALKDLGNAILTNIVNRVKGVIDLFISLKDVGVAAFGIIKEYLTGGNFFEDGAKRIEGYKEQIVDSGKKAAEAFGQAVTGVTNLGDKIGDALTAAKKFYDDTLPKIQRAIDLQKIENNLIVAKRNFLITEQKLNREINKDREQVTNQLLTEEERLEAALRVRENIEKRENARIALLKTELFVLAERNKLSITNEENIEKEAQLRADIIALEAEGYAQQRRNTTQISRLQIQILEREKELALNRVAQATKTAEQSTDAILENARRQYLEEEALLKDALLKNLINRRQYVQGIRDIQREAGEELIRQAIEHTRATLQIALNDAKQRIAIVLSSGLKEAEIAIEVAKIKAEAKEEEIALEKKLFDLKVALQNKILDNQHNEFEDTISLLGEIQSVYQEWAGAINGLFDAITENRIANIDLEIAHEQEARDKLLAQYEGDKQRQAEINETYAEREEALEEKKIRAQRRAAIFNKAVGIVNAGISSAQAVLVQLGGGDPYTAFARAALAGALGAIQVATIAAQPIPKYADGGVTTQRIIQAGERGAELFETPAGRLGLTPNKTTIMDLPVGTKITPAHETSRLLAARGLEYVQKHDRKENSKVEKLLKDLTKTVKNKREVIVQGSIKGERRGATRINYINSLRNR